MGFVIPACMLIYGWSVAKAKGGVAVPVIMLFIQGEDIKDRWCT
jgi:hypothetical protein